MLGIIFFKLCRPKVLLRHIDSLSRWHKRTRWTRTEYHNRKVQSGLRRPVLATPFSFYAPVGTQASPSSDSPVREIAYADTV